MAEDSHKLALHAVLGIVAIVALVALMLLFTQRAKAGVDKERELPAGMHGLPTSGPGRGYSTDGVFETWGQGGRDVCASYAHDGVLYNECKRYEALKQQYTYAR